MFNRQFDGTPASNDVRYGLFGAFHSSVFQITTKTSTLKPQYVHHLKNEFVY